MFQRVLSAYDSALVRVVGIGNLAYPPSLRSRPRAIDIRHRAIIAPQKLGDAAVRCKCGRCKRRGCATESRTPSESLAKCSDLMVMLSHSRNLDSNSLEHFP